MKINSITTNESGTAIFNLDDGRACAFGGVGAGNIDGVNHVFLRAHDPNNNGELFHVADMTSPADPTLAEFKKAVESAPGGVETYARLQIEGSFSEKAVDVAPASVAPTAAAAPTDESTQIKSDPVATEPAATPAAPAERVTVEVHPTMLGELEHLLAELKVGVLRTPDEMRAIAHKLYVHLFLHTV